MLLKRTGSALSRRIRIPAGATHTVELLTKAQCPPGTYIISFDSPSVRQMRLLCEKIAVSRGRHHRDSRKNAFRAVTKTGSGPQLEGRHALRADQLFLLAGVAERCARRSARCTHRWCLLSSSACVRVCRGRRQVTLEDRLATTSTRVRFSF
jgi:hypothetical protein